MMDRRRFLLTIPGVAMAARAVPVLVPPALPPIAETVPFTVKISALSEGMLAELMRAELQTARMKACVTAFCNQEGPLP